MSLLRNIIQIGENFEDPDKSSTVWVQNSFALASTVLAIPFEIYFATLSEWMVVTVFLLTQIVLITALIFGAKGYAKTSKLIIISAFSGVLPIYSLIIGFDSGFYIYYMLGPPLIGTIFDYSEKKFFYSSGFLALLSLVLCIYLGQLYPNSIIGLDTEIASLIYRVNLVVCFVILSYVTYHMVKHHYRTNGQLRNSNQQLHSLIKEKEILLAEVHHRVKNNLAVMSSLTNLQIHQTQNPEAKNLLMRNADRLQSMSLIHNYLYDQQELDKIDFKTYLKDLLDDLIKSHKSDHIEIATQLDLDQIIIPLNKALPLGLITNEIVVNSFKHAFPSTPKGELHLSLKNTNGLVELFVADNGVGFEGFASQDSLGTSLINDLVDQIDGKLEVFSAKNEGTKYHIQFSIN